MGRGTVSRGTLGVVVVLSLAACGGSPTSPSEEPAVRPRSPYVVVEGRPDLQKWSEDEWPRVAACVGLDPEVLRAWPVKVEPDWFYCGSVAAVGCMDFARIRATEYYQGRRYYEGVLHHEYIHLALWKLPGDTNIGHDNPLFVKCDNEGYHHADDGSYSFERDAWVAE